MDRVVEAVCDYADALAYELLDDRTQERAKLVLVDAMAAALAGARHPAAQVARALAPEVDGSPGRGCTVLGTRQRSTPDLAAFAGCATMRCLDHGAAYHALVSAHPSDQIPGLLAAAELSGSGGRDVLTATVLAYEILCRLCDVASIPGWQGATLSAISTAAAASRVLGLSRRQTGHAVSLATVSHAALDVPVHGAGGLDWRAYAGANAVRQGVFAALLAREGVEGPARPFEGEGGFFERLSAGPFELPAVEEIEARPRIHDVLLQATPDDVNATFLALTTGVLSPTLGRTVLDVLWGFDALEDVGILFQLLGGAAG